MKLYKRLLGAVASASLLGAGAAFAAGNQDMNKEANSPNTVAATDSAGKLVKGEITQVLKDDHELLLSDRAAPLVVSQHAKIQRDGKDVGFGDLKPGDDVRASYDANGAKIISIDATSKYFQKKTAPETNLYNK